MSIEENARLSTLSALSRDIRCYELDCLAIRNNPMLPHCEALYLAEELGLDGFFEGNGDPDTECRAIER